jgi:hypothetical protein
MTNIDTTRGTSTLYDQDFLLWVETTVAHLHARNGEALDWEHVIFGKNLASTPVQKPGIYPWNGQIS